MDYKELMIDELVTLSVKIGRLERFMNDWSEDLSKEDKELMERQLEGMRIYLEALRCRVYHEMKGI